MTQFFCSTWAPSLELPGRDRVKVIWRWAHQSSRMMVDELAAVVGVDAEDRERHDLGDLGQCRYHPFAGHVGHRAVLGPAGGDVSHGQGVGVIPDRVAALVADQVDLDEPWHRIIPLRPGPDRDL